MCFYLRVNLFAVIFTLGLRNTWGSFKDTPVHGGNEKSSRIQYRESKSKIKKKS